MKKLLALVLALVMSMSLVTISNAAFADADDIDYTEAVEVLNAVGVLVGSDGKFNPTAELNRAQACKIIAYLDLGAKAADAIKGSGEVFSDVAATAWYAGYVEYCAGAGYVSGVGDGKFAPDANVTGVQFAKMLLCALGYQAEVEGYNGSDWSLSIARDANKIDLFDGLSIATSANLTREQAAQMALNALEATCVEYEGGTNVSTSDGTKVTVNAKRSEVKAASGVDYNKSDDGKQQLCEKLYKKDLVKEADDDDFGRPATKWTYDSKKVGVYADEPIATFTGVTSENAVYTALNGDGASEKVDQIYRDGVKLKDTYSYRKATTDNAPYFGNGIKVELYEVEATVSGKTVDQYRLVSIRDYLGRVSAVNKADEDIDQDRSVVIELQTAPYPFTDEKTCKAYETEDFARKDWVIVNVAVDVVYDKDNSIDYDKTTINVKSAEAATKLSDKAVTAYKQGGANGTGSVTFGGEKYGYSQNFVGDKKDINSQTYEMSSGNSYDFWLDSYGNVIKAAVYSETSTDYYRVIAASDVKKDDFDKNEYHAYKVVGMDGEVSTVKVMGKTKINENTIVTMTEDDDNDGYMEFTTVTSNWTDSITAFNKTTATLAYKVSGKTATVGLNNDTVFVVEYESGKFKAVKGLSNMDSWTGLSTTPLVVIDDGVAEVVYMNTYAKDATTSTSSDDLVYVVSTSASVSYDADNKYYVNSYKAIVDGEMTEVQVVETAKGGTDLTAKDYGEGLYKITATKDGYAKTLVKISNETSGYDVVNPSSFEATFKSGVLTLASGKSFVVADDAVVYVIDSKDNLTVTDAEALDGTLTGDAYVVMESSTDYTVNAIYFQGTIK